MHMELEGLLQAFYVADSGLVPELSQEATGTGHGLGTVCPVGAKSLSLGTTRHG